MTHLAGIWLIGSAVGLVAVVALTEWVRLRHPDRWTARTGLDARTRQPLRDDWEHR